MNYELKKLEPGDEEPKVTLSSIKKLMVGEYSHLALALVVILLNSILVIAAPLFLGSIIDVVSNAGDGALVTKYSLLLLGIYIFIAITSYFQMRLTGSIGQRVLFRLRGAIFEKLQSFPVAFFNANKSGDLISRINNDTEKLNQFFSEGLVRLVSEVFTIAGIGIFVVILNWKLGLVTLSAAAALFIISTLLAPWIKRLNRKSLEATGSFSADIQENLNNYKVLVVFNRKDYFRKKMQETNKMNYDAAVRAGIANTVSAPIYDLASKVSYLLVLIFGLYLVSQGEITLGLFVSFVAYANSFYGPLRELASVYSMVQKGLAAWVRIQDILTLQSDKVVIADTAPVDAKHILEFKNVDFGYTSERLILKDISFNFEQGKTYALVGPTGGGKSTTASLMAHLYDPIEGQVLLQGRDIRSFSDEERSETIGFILQDPYIFTGTLCENLLYGNKKYEGVSTEDFVKELEAQGLHEFLSKFSQGIDTMVSSSDENISLGQKQIIAFMRTLLRKPKLLILDEATANIDTVTEATLQKIIDFLPAETTKIIIAHRLNTISKADEIIFINAGKVQKAQSFDDTLDLIHNSKRAS